MLRFVLKIAINATAVFIAALVIPDVTVDSIATAAIVAILLGTLNTFVKPLLILLTLPITILTLGLFGIVINILLLFLVAAIVPGFTIASVLGAILFSIVLAFVSSFLNLVAN
jgi:putative membrane protein